MSNHINNTKYDEEPTILTKEVLKVTDESYCCIFVVINLEISVREIRVIDINM